jgi:hypothetical protein
MPRTARWAVALLPSRGGVSGAQRTDGVHTAGLSLFAVLTLLMALSKLIGVHDWSWWRVCLPVGVYVAFNVAYVGTGFIYLSRPNIEDRPSEDETALLEEHAKTPYFWLAWAHVALFSIGVTEWIAPSEALNGFWSAFGNLGVMIAFGSLAVVNLFLYWSSIGSWLDESQSTSGGETRRRII